MKRELRWPNTVKIDLKVSDDIYTLQKALIDKGSTEGLRIVAEELASNMVEFNETGTIIANCERVDCFIEKISVDTAAEAFLRLGMHSIENSSKSDTPLKLHKSKNDVGGYGLKFIKCLGWDTKFYETKNYFVIAAKKKIH